MAINATGQLTTKLRRCGEQPKAMNAENNDPNRLAPPQSSCSALLACPFCGWKFPEIQEVNLGMFRKDIHYRIECGMCGIQQRYLNKDKSIAIALWNSRQANARTELPPPDTTVASKKNVQ